MVADHNSSTVYSHMALDFPSSANCFLQIHRGLENNFLPDLLIIILLDTVIKQKLNLLETSWLKFKDYFFRAEEQEGIEKNKSSLKELSALLASFRECIFYQFHIGHYMQSMCVSAQYCK